MHAFQRPDADYVDSDPTATTLQGHAGSVGFGKIAGEKTRFNTNFGYKTPGFDSNDLGFMRRADEKNMGNWFQWRDFKPGKYVRTYQFNLNQWAGWNFGGDRLYSGGNVNTHWTWTNYYSNGFGINVDAAPFRDRATRGGPGVLGNPSKSVWYYVNTDNRKPLSFYYNGNHWGDQYSSVRHGFNPGVNWRATSVDHRSTSASATTSTTTMRSGWRTRPTRRARRATCSARIDQTTVGDQRPLQLHDDADVVAADLRRAVRVGRRLLELQGAGGRPRPATTPIATRRTPTAATPTSTTARSAPPTCCAGNTSRAPRCSWCGSRASRTRESYGDFRFGRDFSGVFAAPSHNVFLVKFSYWLNM